MAAPLNAQSPPAPVGRGARRAAMAFIFVMIILDTLGFGIIIPVLAPLGVVLGGFGVRLPFWAAAIMSLASAGYGLVVLPESLPAGIRKRFSWRRANPAGSLTLLRSHRELIGLAGVNFLSFLAFQVLP